MGGSTAVVDQENPSEPKKIEPWPRTHEELVDSDAFEVPLWVVRVFIGIGYLAIGLFLLFILFVALDLAGQL